jgi:hypothetical protein
MRKTLLIILIIIASVNTGYSQVSTLWQKSAGSSSLPVWFSTSGNSERGLSYGFVGGNHRLYIVSRNGTFGGKQVYIYNAATGDSVGRLDTTGTTGGTHVVSDVEVSTNGVIFVCNLTTNASTSPFKVYKYTSEGAAPVLAINYTAPVAARLGDKFTVTGSTADNSIIIWAASANTQELYKFTTTDNGNTFSAAILPLSGLTGTSFGSASVGPLTDGSFYWNSGGFNVKRYTAAGTVVGTVPGTVVATGSNAVRFLRTFIGDEYFITFAYGSGNENGRIVKVRYAIPDSSVLFGTTTTLGTNTNSGGTGDVSVRKISDLEYNVFVLSTNNGFGAYKVILPIPPLAGNYYIGDPGTGPGGSNPQFAGLRDAFDVMNDATYTADCNFYITSNINEPYTASIGLGLAIDPSPYTVTLKPYTGVQPVITLAYPSDLNSGPSGALIIGIPSKGNISWDSLRTTKNIVIDGSNTVGGTTRDLTIQNATTAQRNGFPLVLVGDVSNVVIKNTNLYYKAQGVSTSGNLFVSAVLVRSRNYLSQDWVPRNLLFDNNHISANFDGVVQSAQGYGCYQSGTPLPGTYPYNIILKDNKIEGKRRGISLYRAGGHDIFGNEVILNQSIVANTTNEAIYAVDVDTNSVVNIFNNRISSVASISSGTNVGNTAISIESFGTYNIYNNMIYGFNLTAANPTAFLRGIKNASSSATLNLNYNSIYMSDIPSIGSGVVTYQGIYLTNGTNTVQNNIIYDAEPDFSTYCIYREGTSGTLVSDYNNFYPVNPTNGNVGYWNTAATPTLANWQTASGQDANSITKQVFFVSATDLHLTGSSNGDFDLIGTPIAGITDDIDGDLRNANFPYMGCDEASIPLPVELATFGATVVSGEVYLKWTTSSETNNQGFEIQRSNGKNFEAIGFVPGNGTTSQSHSYSFADSDVESGVYSYRLKQIDMNGDFSYSNVIEVDVTSPLHFDLSQNYPNPFNPATTINYEIAAPVNVTLIIYNTLGEQVEVLINNQMTEPGKYSVRFDASNLASGTYIYRLTAGDFVQTKKMMLTK